MFIQTEATPNPATLKFLPGQTVLETGTLDLREPADAAKSPLAERLFAIKGVNGVFFGSDFITVTKTDGEGLQLSPRSSAPSWSTSCPARRCWAGESGGNDDRTNFSRAPTKRSSPRSSDLIETRASRGRQRRRRHHVPRFQGRHRLLHMKGACSGCPSSTATLRHGIQNLLKHYVPEVVEVRPV